MDRDEESFLAGLVPIAMGLSLSLSQHGPVTTSRDPGLERAPLMAHIPSEFKGPGAQKASLLRDSWRSLELSGAGWTSSPSG